MYDSYTPALIAISIIALITLGKYLDEKISKWQSKHSQKRGYIKHTKH